MPPLPKQKRNKKGSLRSTSDFPKAQKTSKKGTTEVENTDDVKVQEKEKAGKGKNIKAKVEAVKEQIKKTASKLKKKSKRG